MSRHRKSKRRMRLSSRILLFSAIVFLVAAVALLGYSLHKRAQDRKILEQEDHLRDLFQGTACEITERACSLFPAASAEEAEPTAAPEIAPRFQELYGINPDIIGWITAGSEVSTAVVYRDNEYYMDHDFYGKSSAAGTVFADVLNEHWETDPYVVLYGHNMRNGAMFGNMDHYMNLDYFKQNSDICLYNIYSDEPVHYVPFAAVDASMNKEEDSYFYLRRYSTFMPWIYAEDVESATETRSPEQQTAVDEAIAEMRERSLFDIPGVEVDGTDRILALVTCSYELPDARFILFCRQLRPEETPEAMAQKIMETAVAK